MGKRRVRDPLVDWFSEEEEGGFLEPTDAGWRFIRAPKGFAMLGNIGPGYILLNEPWRSCWLLGPQLPAGSPPSAVHEYTFGKPYGPPPMEPWSIAADDTLKRRMGIPADWARALLDKSGVPYTVTPERVVPKGGTTAIGDPENTDEQQQSLAGRLQDLERQVAQLMEG